MREVDEYDNHVRDAGEWVLDLSRLATLTGLDLKGCPTVTDEQVQAVSSLTGPKFLVAHDCNVTAEALQALRTALPKLSAY